MRNLKRGFQNRDYPARIVEKHFSEVKGDFQSVLRTLKSLFTNFVSFHVRHCKM